MDLRISNREVEKIPPAMPILIKHSKVEYSFSKKDNFPNSNSPSYSFLENYFKHKLEKNKLDLDNLTYSKYAYN